jgi:hypothetical protein
MEGTNHLENMLLGISEPGFLERWWDVKVARRAKPQHVSAWVRLPEGIFRAESSAHVGAAWVVWCMEYNLDPPARR